MSRNSEINKVTRGIRLVYSELEGVIEKSKERCETEGGVSCKKGCSSCCKQMVFITIPEALVMVEDLSENSVVWDSFKKRLNKQIAWLEDPGASVEKWFNEQKECAFLWNGECRIYENRPAVCRTLLVVSDPIQCTPQATGKIKRIAMRNILTATYRAEKKLMNTTGIGVYMLPLPVSARIAMTIWEEGFSNVRKRLKGIWENHIVAAEYWAKKLKVETKKEVISCNPSEKI